MTGVDLNDSGKRRCAASCLAPTPDWLGAELFLEAATELIGEMLACEPITRAV